MESAPGSEKGEGASTPASESPAPFDLLHPTDAERLFTDTFMGSLFRWTNVIGALRLALQLGLPEAEKRFAQLSDFDTYFKELAREGVILDEEALRKHHPPEEMSKKAVAALTGNAQVAVDAASIIFAHSILDAAALDYCRVIAMHAPADWDSTVEKKQLALSAYKGSPYEQLRKELIERELAQLEKDSLLKKTDTLFMLCKPASGADPDSSYRFDREHLERLDDLRHEIIHGPKVEAIPNVEGELEYMKHTATFLALLLARRYGFKLSLVHLFEPRP